MNTAELQQYLQEILTALAVLGPGIILAIGIMLVIGVILIIQGVLRLWQKRLLAAGFRGVSGIICAGVAVITLLIAMNIYTYHRLIYEKPLVKLIFTEQGLQQYRVILEYLDAAPHSQNRQEEYLLAGDEWQLDARVLRWKPVIQLLGFNAMYRLERLNGRYAEVSDELSQPRTVYPLAHDQGLDIWSLTQQFRQWLDWIDAYYGSAAYLPMADKAEYLVVINQSGLVARPANDIAEQALQQW